MLDERVLDLDGTHPDPADLHHVVGTARVPVIAVGILAVLVPGSNPPTFNRRLGLVVLVPVARARRIAADEQVADLSHGDVSILVVDDASLVSFDDPAARPGSNRAGAV